VEARVGLDCAEDVDTLEIDLTGLDGVGKSSKEYSVKRTQSRYNNIAGVVSKHHKNIMG